MKAARAKRQAQSKVEKGTKRKKGTDIGPPPKKARTPPAALGRAPLESETETMPATPASTLGKASAAMALGASSLENYLIGGDLLTPGTAFTVEQAQTPTS